MDESRYIKDCMDSEHKPLRMVSKAIMELPESYTQVQIVYLTYSKKNAVNLFIHGSPTINDA